MVLYIWASVYLFACMSIHLRSYISTYQCVHTVCRYLYASLQLDIYLYICLDTTLIYLYVRMSTYGISRCLLHLRPSHCEVTPGSSQGPGRKGVWFDPQILKPLQAPPRGSPGGSGSTLKFWNLSRRSAPKPGVRVRRSPGEILGDPGPGNPPPPPWGNAGTHANGKSFITVRNMTREISRNSLNIPGGMATERGYLGRAATAG